MQRLYGVLAHELKPVTYTVDAQTNEKIAGEYECSGVHHITGLSADPAVARETAIGQADLAYEAQDLRHYEVIELPTFVVGEPPVQNIVEWCAQFASTN